MDLRPALSLLEAAVADQVVPGGVLLVADRGGVVAERAFGLRARVPAPGPPTTPDTAYDAASLTKPIVTVSLAAQLIAEGALSLETRCADLLPGLCGRIRLRHLLSHSSGLPAWRPFHERLRAGERAGAMDARAAILRMAAAEALEAEPGARSVYSDLGFMLLGAIVERAAGARLDELASRRLFGPLGMCGSRFVDLARPGAARPAPVAPTEICPYRGLVVGEVHDDNCHAAGGVLGHAGLFTTAADVSRLVSALVEAWHGDDRGPFAPAVVRSLFTPCGVPGSTWRHGWDGPSPEPGASQAGDLWPKDGVGHMGFTGTSVWVDPERRRWVVLLTNRVHPSRDDQRIKQVRPKVHDAITAALG